MVAGYLFGSRARGDNTAKSDVDLGLLLATTPLPGLDATGQILASDLAAVLRVEVEPVVLNSASADLVHRVLRDGIVVYERDRSARIQFEVRKRNEYFDLLPILQEYRKEKRPREMRQNLADARFC